MNNFHKMKITIITKNQQIMIFNDVIQTAITHTGNDIDDYDYNTLQIIYLINNIKQKHIIRLNLISTCIILSEVLI